MDALSQLKQDLDAKWCTSLRVRWLQECLVFLESASHSNGLSSRSTLTTQVEDQLLLSDLGYSTHGCIPLDVASRHGQVLRGKFLVQVQDCVNVSESSDRRYSHTTNRTLKMGLFDGKISVTAMELTHIPQISLDFPAGFKMLVKDPKMAHGMLVLTSENVVVLGGRVETLAARTEAIKTSLQRSTLPKEWTDSLGQIDDLPTDTRLEGDVPDSNQTAATNSSPVRPSLPNFAAPLHDEDNNRLPSTLFRASRDTMSASLTTPNASPSTSHPPIASSPSLSSLIRTEFSTPSHLTAVTPTISSRNSLVPSPGLDSERVTLAQIQPHSAASLARRMDVDVPDVRSSPYHDSLANSNPPFLASAPSLPLASSSSKEVISAQILPEEDITDVMESVDAYIDRIESSQVADQTAFGTQESEQDELWMEHDMEDYFDPSDRPQTLESEELIEPSDALPTADEDDEDDDSDMVHFGNDRSNYNPNKRRKLFTEQDGDDEEDMHKTIQLHASNDGGSGPNQKEDELMYMTETEYEAQMERNAQMALISELQFATNKKRKYKIHATCIETLPLELTNGSVNWTIVITDPSNEELYVRVAPSVAVAVFGIDASSSSSTPSELSTVLKSNEQLINSTESLEKAKEAFTSDVVIAWDNAAQAWMLIGL